MGRDVVGRAGSAPRLHAPLRRKSRERPRLSVMEERVLFRKTSRTKVQVLSFLREDKVGRERG